MKLTLDSRNQHRIRSYAPGEVRVNERVLHSNCLIAPDQIVADWTGRSADSLSFADLQSIFALHPELVLLGTGAQQQFPPAVIQAAFQERGIGFEVMNLGAACRTFNILLSEDRRVVAALLLE